MMLREKFLNVHTTSGGVGMNEKQADGCVTIADKYAEGFGKWLRENDDESLMMSHLLEIFYNQKKL